MFRFHRHSSIFLINHMHRPHKLASKVHVILANTSRAHEYYKLKQTTMKNLEFGRFRQHATH